MTKIKLPGVLSIVAAIILISCSSEDKTNETDIQNSRPEAQSNNIPQNNGQASKSVEAKSGKVFLVSSVEEAVPGKPVDFTWEQDGQVQRFSDLAKGKALFVNFWGTWCGPCRMEIPDLIELNKELQEEDFLMISITLERNPNNQYQIVSSFVSQQGIDYYVFVDPNRELVNNYYQAFGMIDAVPTTLIYDRDHNLIQSLRGAKSKEIFMNEIAKVIDIKS